MKITEKTYQNQSDEDLMIEVTKGNSRAFSELYNRYHLPLYHFFYKMLWQDQSKAEDFMQDLFTKIIHKPHLFNPKFQFKTWIYTIANNMCKNEYRKQEVRKISKNKIPENYHSSSNDDIINQVERTDFKHSLNDELKKLSFNHKQIFILRFKQGLSIKEIADLLEISEGTVKSRIFYTLKKLNTNLKAFSPALLTFICLMTKLLPL